MATPTASEGLRQLARRKGIEAIGIIGIGAAAGGLIGIAQKWETWESRMPSFLVIVGLSLGLLVAAKRILVAIAALVLSLPTMVRSDRDRVTATFTWIAQCIGCLLGFFMGQAEGHPIIGSALGFFTGRWAISEKWISFDEVLFFLSYEESSHQTQPPSQNQAASPIDPYTMLGCQPGASHEEVKRRYRELARRFHPDTLSGKNLPEEFIVFATEKFRQIQTAFEAISGRVN